MTKTDIKTETLTLAKGFFQQEQYDDYSSMHESAGENWDFACTYQLKPHGLNGEHKFLQLDSMQLSFGARPGGMMHDTQTPEGSIAVGLIEEVRDKACFDTMKLQSGELLFFDDSRPYSLMSNDLFCFSVVSIDKKSLGKKWPLFEKALLHRVKDQEKNLETLLHQTWSEYTTEPFASDYEKREKEIIALITSYLETQVLQVSKLTEGEKTALAIRDQVYAHMDGKLNIATLAKQYNISEKTLQRSFKSLFGFTPKLFIRQLKLNHVRKDLSSHTDQKRSVYKVANKWGFLHMGRFSQYYTELFGENPSQTLKRSFLEESSLAENCVARQEEML